MADCRAGGGRARSDVVVGKPCHVDALAHGEEQARYTPGVSPGPAGTSPDASEVDGGAWASQPSGSPWLRWLRPRASGRRSSGHSTPNAAMPRPPPDGVHLVDRQDFEELEDRLLQLFADLHRQVASDHHEAERLAELSAARLEAQIGMAGQQHHRLERRVTEMNTFVQSLDEEQQAQGRRVGVVNEMLTNMQASRGQSELDLQRRLADVEQDQRVLQGATHAAAARDEEAQRRWVNRLRPIEERLSNLESEQRRAESMSPQAPGSGAVALRGCSSDWELESRGNWKKAIQDLEASLMDETRVIHARCNQMQDIVDNHVIQPMQKLERLVERLSAGDRTRASLLEEQESRLERHERQVTDLRERLERLSLTAGSHTASAQNSPAKLGRRLSPEVRRLRRPHSVEALTELDLQPSSSSCPNGMADCDSAKAKDSHAWATTGTPQSASEAGELVRRVQAEFSETREQMNCVVRQLAQLQQAKSTSLEGCGQDVSGYGLDRLNELESRVQENATVMGRLQDFIQQSMDDIKGCIDLAVCTRSVESNGSPGLFHRVDVLENEARNLGEAIVELRSEPSISAVEALSRSPFYSPEANDGFNRLERFEGLVSDIQDHVAVLGKQFEETLATKQRRPQVFSMDSLDSEDEAGDESRGEQMISWVEADALLRSVERVVGRQQNELAKLTKHLNLQCLEASAESCDSTKNEMKQDDTVADAQDTKAQVKPASPQDACGRSSESPAITKARSPRRERRSPGLLGGSSAPWSALAHLSTLMTGFEAAVEASTSGASPPSGEQPDSHASTTGASPTSAEQPDCHASTTAASPSSGEQADSHDSSADAAGGIPMDSTVPVESVPPVPVASSTMAFEDAERREASELAGWNAIAEFGVDVDTSTKDPLEHAGEF